MNVLIHEVRETYRSFRYPGYEAIHHPFVQKFLNEALKKVAEGNIPEGSEWKRVEPGKQVVVVDQVVWQDDGEVWMVHYHPLKGGRAMSRDVAWFTENFKRHDV